MKIAVLADEESWNELDLMNPGIEWLRSENIDAFMHADADAYFNLTEDAAHADHNSIKEPVFINSVNTTLKEINAAENIYRINGWKGFIKRNSWEVAGNMNETSLYILEMINKKFIAVPDEPGLIAARIISMIINEAYFAKAENVSTETEIDIAMKLGTNYPYGPFEWAKIIGIKNVYDLLKNLSENDKRYIPSSLLEKEVIEN